MPAYRLYDLDGAGQFSAAEWMEAEDDESALDAARALAKSCRCEVWRGPTFIGAIDPPPANPVGP